MRILLLNTSELTGGAAIACNRLMHALNASGCEAKMLVRDKQTNDPDVVSINNGKIKQLLNKWRFYWERGVIFLHNHFSRKDLFRVSIANTGNDISQHPLVKEADIIHLHWVNQGFLSLRDIEKLTQLGKPIVWTMHDMWPCTGGCHHSRECNNYQTQCHNCFYLLEGTNKKDLSCRTFQRKLLLFAKADIHFVTCSQWLCKRAETSALFANQSCISIPNPINISLYHPNERASARTALGLPIDEMKLVLFGSAKITDERKGIHYMIEACKKIAANDKSNRIGLVVFGAQSTSMVGATPMKTYPLEYLSNFKDIVNLYNAVDVFVTPSLEENLPNTIMESMACGTPCVGFKTGGIPEMIDHKQNGYIAEYQDAEDLARGIRYVLEEADYEQLSRNARQKVEQCYAESVVAKKYMELYNEQLTLNK